MSEDERREFGKQMEYEDMLIDSDENEYDEDYEEKQIDKLDQDITNRHKEHQEYTLSGRVDKSEETKEQKMQRKKIEKGKRNMQLQLDNANRLELAKYNNKDVGGQSDSEDSQDTDSLIDDTIMKKVEKIQKAHLKRQKIEEEQEFINPLVATKKDIKRMKNKNKDEKEKEVVKGIEKESKKESKKEPKKEKTLAQMASDDEEIEEFESDAEEIADKLDKGIGINLNECNK